MGNQENVYATSWLQELIVSMKDVGVKGMDEVMKFNFFQVCGITRKEIYHSRVIAELLNPKGMHNCGDVFFQSFCRMVKLPVDKLGDTKVAVVKEKHLYNGRADIYIALKNQCQIIIENKVDSSEHEDQLQRYAKNLNNGRDWLLYLTLNGTSPKEKIAFSNFRCISYSAHILKWMDECVSILNTQTKNNNDEVRINIEQYQDTIRRLTNQTKKDFFMSQLSNEILKNGEFFKYSKWVTESFYVAVARKINLIAKVVAEEGGIHEIDKELSTKIKESPLVNAWSAFRYKILGVEEYNVCFEFQDREYKKLICGLTLLKKECFKSDYKEAHYKKKIDSLLIDSTVGFCFKNSIGEKSPWILKKEFSNDFLKEIMQAENFSECKEIKEKIKSVVEDLVQISSKLR